MSSELEFSPTGQKQRRIIGNVALELAQAADDELDAAIDRLLGAVAASDGADRGYVQLFSPDRQTIECLYEWNRPEVRSRFRETGQYSTLNYSYSVTRMLNDLHLHVPDAASLPEEAQGERQAMARHGVFSTLLVPLLRDSQVIGLVGFDSVRGSVRWSDESIEQVRSVGEAIVRALERRDVAHELKAARSEAERANDAKNYFLSRMSHELRTPLNAILGFTELLLETKNRPAFEVQSLGQIREAGRHLVALIDDVLDISRIESGRIPVKLTEVQLDRAVERAMDMVRSSGIADDVTMAVGASTSIGLVVEADETRLDQVLVNVLSNAAKYNVDGGSVTVSCGRLDTHTASVSITDTGVGIAQENLPRLFEPFDRLGQEGSTVQGTGVGLSLVKTLMETMAGEILVTSKLGVGTTVELRIPLTRQARPELYANEPTSTRATDDGTEPGRSDDTAGCRVVAFDDDVAGVAILRRIIEHHHGGSLHTVEDATQILGHGKAAEVVFVSSEISDDEYDALARDPEMSGVSLHRLYKPYRIVEVTEALASV